MTKGTERPWVVSVREIERREKGISRLCRVFGTSRAFICDFFLTRQVGIPSIDPMRLEKWLARRGKGVGEGESLYETLERHYGTELADLAQSLV